MQALTHMNKKNTQQLVWRVWRIWNGISEIQYLIPARDQLRKHEPLFKSSGPKRSKA